MSKLLIQNLIWTKKTYSQLLLNTIHKYLSNLYNKYHTHSDFLHIYNYIKKTKKIIDKLYILNTKYYKNNKSKSIIKIYTKLDKIYYKLIKIIYKCKKFKCNNDCCLFKYQNLLHLLHLNHDLNTLNSNNNHFSFLLNNYQLFDRYILNLKYSTCLNDVNINDNLILFNNFINTNYNNNCVGNLIKIYFDYLPNLHNKIINLLKKY